MSGTESTQAGVRRLQGRAALRANGVWAPFEKGNQAARTHGAYSAAARLPRVQQLVAWVLAQEALAHISDESFRPAVFRWAERQAMADLMFAALERHHTERADDSGVCPGCKKCRGWEERWQKFDRTAERAAAAIGLDPQSRATLLDRMNATGLLNLAEEASDLLSGLLGGMREMYLLEDHIATLEAILRAQELPVPARPTWAELEERGTSGAVELAVAEDLSAHRDRGAGDGGPSDDGPV